MNEENQEKETKDFSMEWNLTDNNWIMGVALILSGGLFLLDTMNIVQIDLSNWWAIFILIPGINMAVNGWRRYQRSGSKGGLNTSLWGLVLIIVAFAFFFDIAWSLVFPVVLIAMGAYLLLTR